MKAEMRRNGTVAEIRIPQDLELAIIRTAGRLNLSATEILVALAIRYRQFQYGPDAGRAQVLGHEEIAAVIGKSRSAVLRAIASLAGHGLVTAERAPGGRRPHRAHAYALVLAAWTCSADATPRCSADDTPSGPEGVPWMTHLSRTDATPGVAPTPHLGVASSNSARPYTSKEKQEKHFSSNARAYANEENITQRVRGDGGLQPAFGGLSPRATRASRGADFDGAGEAAAAPRRRGRPRVYESDAARARAWRQRQKAKQP